MRMLKIGLMLAALLLPAVPAAAEPVTLRFWVAWDPTQAATQATIDHIAAFQQAHPDIRIETQNIAYGALHDKLMTALAGGDAPDISWGLPEWFGELSRMDALLDVTPYAADWADSAAIYPNVIDALTIDGKLMAMPHYLGIRALLVHDDMLKQAGIAGPPKTWDELIAAAAKIKAATGKYGFGIAGTGVRAPQELIMYLAQNDVAIARRQADGGYRNSWADDPAELARATAVFAFYRRLLDEGAIPPEAAGWGYEEEDSNFALGKYAMVVDGAWMQERAQQNPQAMADVSIAAPPYGARPATFFEINPFYLFKSSKHPQELWAFASFMTGKPFQAASRSATSVRTDVVAADRWGHGFVSLAPTGVVFPPVALGRITRAMEESIGRVLLKQEDPAAVAAWLGAQINRALRQSGELSPS
ncbi:ABC transporter substrate-binding protein [Inquilinus sp.]|jgi:multiple sugar transport system substrate-binding protein|uniref:ABC transporter substrate-binding protein n=1 Tax=Inquilinus sp. TaxID=1932117 RepID=UPI0037838969